MTNSRQPHDRVLTLLLRLLQFVTSVVALALVVSSFQPQKRTFQTDRGERHELTVYYGGPAVTFAVLVCFSACLYSAFLLLFTFMRRNKVPTSTPWSFGIDALLTMLFMSAGCALAASDYMRYCDVLREVVQCVYLASGAALCFMAFVSFLLSVAWGAWRRNSWIPSSGKVPHDAPNTIETVLQSGATSDVLVLGNTELDRERATTSTYVQDGFFRPM